jgi:hypothetical protein
LTGSQHEINVHVKDNECTAYYRGEDEIIIGFVGAARLTETGRVPTVVWVANGTQHTGMTFSTNAVSGTTTKAVNLTHTFVVDRIRD